MTKPLNMFRNIVTFAPPTGEAIGSGSFQARLPRLAFGFLGATLAAATIAVSVVLPAQLDSDAAGAIMSITVVAAREPRASTRPLRIVEAVTSSAPSGETTSSPILRISTAAR